jgi:ubiquinone/menaquinone biosynthesis C-methylase UbiE
MFEGYVMTTSYTDHQIFLLNSARLESWGQINPYRLRFVRQYAGSSVLDVGCSTGSYVTYLNTHGYKAYGIDLLADPSWMASSKVVNTVGSLVNLPFVDTAVQTLLAFEVLEHIPDIDYAMSEMYRVARQNIIVSVPDCDLPEDMLRAGLIFTHWRDRTHCNFFTEESLKRLLMRHGFRVRLLTRINPVRLEFLSLRSFRVPGKLAGYLSEALRRIPFRQQYHMTLLAVADKNEAGK